ncbi:MAG: hypothetical protein WBN70_00225, partial [Polyangiales bacterium]
MMRINGLALVLGALVALVGCGSDGDSSGTAGAGGGGGAGAPSFQELYDQGLTKYVGMFEPEPGAQQDGDLTTYQFAVPDEPLAEPRGPLCLRGTE